jgi:predicted metalloprotease
MDGEKMRWRTGRRSSNIEDRRGRRVSRGVAGGGLGTVVIVLVALYFGVDPGVLMQGVPTQSYTTETAPPSPEQQELADFVSVVLADTEDTWNAIFQQSGQRYQEPKLVLFTGAVQSACGFAQSAMGPFYCPGDQKVYIDLSFYDDLRTRHGAPGDFAQAYVIAHEIGHHVQNLTGISGEVQSMRRRVSETESNQLSVRLELQADCLAGIWANHADRSRQIIEAGDVEEALNAASAIGDDRLQKQATGHVVPESFTHGSSAQRVRWFRQGMTSGRFDACDTFEADRL